MGDHEEKGQEEGSKLGVSKAGYSAEVQYLSLTLTWSTKPLSCGLTNLWMVHDDVKA